MILLARKRNLLILLCAIIFVVSVYTMFFGSIPELVHEKDSEGHNTAEVLAGLEVDRQGTRQVISEKDSDFFIDYKLERDRLRGQEADYLRELINNPNASSESKDKAQQDLIELSQKVEKEMMAENLIKAKGYEDSIIFLSEDFINVVVKSDGLQNKDIAQITDAVTRSTGISVDKITIIERK